MFGSFVSNGMDVSKVITDSDGFDFSTDSELSCFDPFGFFSVPSFKFNSDVKDLQPVKWKKNGNDYVAIIKTLGIKKENIKVTYDNDIVKIIGKNEIYGEKFDTTISFSVNSKISKDLDKIVVDTQDGITFIIFKMKESRKIPVMTK